MVNPESSGLIELFQARDDPGFTDSNFKILFVDTNGGVVSLCERLEQLDHSKECIAVDFEGQKLWTAGSHCVD